MTLRIEHVAVWVRDLERVAEFYARFFGARIGQVYRNPNKGFASRFLEFASGARIEIMTRTDIVARTAGEQLGLAHIALCIGDERAVDALAARFAAEGVALLDGSRRTGDGYYECVVCDPEGNRLEITAG